MSNKEAIEIFGKKYFTETAGMFASKKGMIKICDNHEEYQVPLIWTFAFPGWEYWCPYCCHGVGMLGTGKEVKNTETLAGRATIYEEASKLFLSTQSLMVCSAAKFGNFDVDRADFSQVVFNLAKYVAERSWERNIKASRLMRLWGPDADILNFECIKCDSFVDCKENKTGHCKKWTNKELEAFIQD